MRKFFAAFLVLVLAIMLTLKLKLLFGEAPDIVLAFLVVCGLIFNLYETVSLAAFAAWVLNWQPWPGPELFVLFGVALLSYFGRYFMPWQRWLSLVLLTCGGIVALYAVGTPLAGHWQFILLDAAGSTLFGFIAYRTFRFFYGK